MIDAGVRIAGTGSYLPGRPIDHAALKARLRLHPDGLDEAFQDRLIEATGIRTRHFAEPGETNTSMAAAAGRRALDAAGWAPDDVDLLIVTTVIPDHLMPPTSTLVQEALCIKRCAEMEISANCTAPYKALAVADALLRIGRHRRALICSAQLASVFSLPPWTRPDAMGPDQGQLRWIVSDGAGAMALEGAAPDTGLRPWLDSTGVGRRSGMSLELGAAAPDLNGGLARGVQHVTQNVRYAMRQGFTLAVEGLGAMLSDLAIDAARIDHFVPGVSSMQVADRLVEIGHERFHLPPSSWRLNFTRIGYIGGPGFLVTLDELARSGQLKPGDLICGFAEESSKWMAAGAVLRWNPQAQ